MKFLIVEILSYLIAAGILGLIVGWGLKAMFSRQSLSQMRSKLEAQRYAMEESFDIEVSELNNQNSSMLGEISLLNNKNDALTASIELGDQALSKALAENKSLTEAIGSNQQTLDQARQDAEQALLQQREIQQELESTLASKNQEIEELKQQLSATGSGTNAATAANGSETITEVSAPVTREAPSTVDSEDLESKYAALEEERIRLAQEREKFVAREAHFSSQLPHGDDTQAYMDETIRIEDYQRPFDPLPADEPSFEKNSTVTRSAIKPRISDRGTRNRNTTRASYSSADNHSADSEKPKTLWDKVKTGVAKTVDKTRI